MNSRSLLYLLCCLLSAYAASGQANIPTSATGPGGATAQPMPNYQLDNSWIYIRKLTPKMPTQDSTHVTILSAVDSVLTETEYMDNVERPLQRVFKQFSASKKDLVSPYYYDDFNREVSRYLPYVAQTGNYNDGRIKGSMFQADSVFNTSQYPNDKVFYGQTTFDGSPLERITKQTAAGNSWTGAGVGVSFSYRANTAADSVRLWTIAISSEDDVPSTTAMYQAGSLSVATTTDESGAKLVVYTDELGRKILTKKQLSATPSTGHAGWLCTYYVYDEMNHVRMVIPPDAVTLLVSSAINWNLSGNASINTGYCFSFFYDNHGRTTMKRIPAMGKVYMAYDMLDRLVMVQDPNLRATNQWEFKTYDAESRPYRDGLITSTLSKDTILAQAAASTSYPTLTGTYTIMTELYYDDYTWISATGAPVSSALVTTNINSTNFNTTYNTAPDYAQPLTASSRTRGLVTGSKRIILNSSSYLYTVNLYDDHQRVLQTSSTNYTGGTDVVTVQYSFNGTTLRTHLSQQKSGTNAQTHTLLTKHTYDHVGRLLTTTKNLDNAGDKTITQNTYNELGQVQTKVIGSSMETQNYAYNIRGWLTSINKDFVNTSGSTANNFGEIVDYDYGFTNNRLDGGIGGVKWKAGGDGIARAYGFGYDNAGRLLTADFSQQNQGATAWTSDKVDFSLGGLSYDPNGNMLTLRQKGLKTGTIATIDSLSYTYFSNSNQLEKVSDGITGSSTLGDFQDTTLAGDSYTYDANGNIAKDYNRHMHTPGNGPGAVYNCLNRPDSICIAGHASIYYYYDAVGQMLRRQVFNRMGAPGSTSSNYLFLDGFVYMNDTLSYIMQEEGRIRYAKKKNSVTGATYYAYEYDYFIKDHLGNVRSVMTEGRDTSTYAASMETKDSATVAALFSNVYTPVNTVLAKPSGFDTDTSNHYVSRLNASPSINKTTGPSLVLKVMAGDKVQVSTYAFYNTAVQPPQSGLNLLSGILSVLGNEVIGNSGGKFVSGDLTNLTTTLNPNVSQFLSTGRTYDSTKPKAYLNWILFDDQFNYVSSNSGVQQVQPGGSKQALVAPLQTIGKNGYLYVYVSNESPQDVYFDDITVKQTTGPLQQEQSYYPFGLQMAGISDKALNKLVSEYKFSQGNELEEDGGLDYYSTFYRKYDPQIGRFSGVDPMADVSLDNSPYDFAGNNPILFEDPTGALKNAAGVDVPINTAGDLINFIEQYGLGSLQSGAYNFDFSAQLSDGDGVNGGIAPTISYDPNPRVGENKFGVLGIYMAITQSTPSSDPQKFGDRSMDDIFATLKFIAGDNIPDFSTYSHQMTGYEVGKQLLDMRLDNVLKVASLSATYTDVAILHPFKALYKVNLTLARSPEEVAAVKGVLRGTEDLSKGMTGIVLATTAVDVYENGLQTHSVIDATVAIAGYLCPAFGLIYGAADIATTVFTGKSISEHIQDAIDDSKYVPAAILNADRK